MTQSLAVRFIVIGTCLLISGCSDYEYKFNDRTLFTPVPLFTDYHLQDRALNDCVRQTIFDQRATEAEDLKVLVCTNAGITSLVGLATFNHIEQLNLRRNAIASIEPLARLSLLRILDLSDNVVTDLTALEKLTHLERLGLGGNPALDCTQAEKIQTITQARVDVPEHCN